MSCGVAHRCGLDLALLWLWCRPAAAGLIQPLAREPPCAAGMALTSKIKEWIRFLLNVYHSYIKNNQFNSLYFLFFKGHSYGDMEFPGLGVKLELQLLPYATATATPDP